VLPENNGFGKFKYQRVVREQLHAVNCEASVCAVLSPPPPSHVHTHSQENIRKKIAESQASGQAPGGCTKKPLPTSPQPSFPKPPTQKSTPRPEDDRSPSINVQTYSRDRNLLESKDEMAEQPDAFSSGGRQTPAEIFNPSPEVARKR
jgi:hypothetical protein